jgi:pimeloyl-ACP methyl ester carboxylesterase
VPHIIARIGWLRSVLFAGGVHDWQSISESLATEILPRMAATGFMQSLHAAARAVDDVTPHAAMCPSLVVWGAKDRILPLSTGESLVSKIPDARLLALEGVGHCPMVEAPARFSQLVTEFMRDPVNGRPASQEPALPDVVRQASVS